MEETTFRIMDTLSRELGNPISISKLTERIKEFHGTAYYANIYRELQNLTHEGAITLRKTGNTSIARFNFQNYLLLDLLTEMELRRKHELLKKSQLRIILMDLDARLRNMRRIESIALIKPEQSLKLNRLEFLILLDGDLKNDSRLDYTLTIYEKMRQLQNKHNMKIDSLILSSEEFLELLGSEEINPLREMLPDAIAIYSPNSFWNEIAMSSHIIHGINPAEKETNPARIAERDLIHNLARFGYREMGSEIKKGSDICKEYIITSLLIEKDARHTEAIPILLAKNKVNYSLLIFLSQKYGTGAELLGLLRVLNSMKPTKGSQDAASILDGMEIVEIRPDEESIREKMRLYSAA